MMIWNMASYSILSLGGMNMDYMIHLLKFDQNMLFWMN